MDRVSVAQERTTVDEAIRLDAAANPERTYRQHVDAAERLAANEYREEIRKLMKLDLLEER